MKTLAILGYHKIGVPPVDGWYTWNYVPEDVFEKHLEYLRDNEWKVIDAKQFLEGLELPDTFPSKAVLITFDDGYKSTLEIALPILQKFSYPAIVFVPTAFVGSYNAFDADIFYEPKEDICTWEELLELEQSGISIQSHSVNHSHFSKLTQHELIQEIKLSKKILEAKLNKQVELFSFPYGDNGMDASTTDAILMENGYRAAFLFAGQAICTPVENNFRIPRVAIGPDSDLKSLLEVPPVNGL